MTEMEYKILHKELWSFIVAQMELARSFSFPLPCVLEMKQLYFSFAYGEKKEVEQKKVMNLCYACEAAKGDCDICPLELHCIDFDSPFSRLVKLEGTFEYSKGISLAKEIRENWRN